MVDKSSYVEYDQNTLEVIIDNIVGDSCVLFMGPLFGEVMGENKEKEKINMLMFRMFETNNIKVDHDFQNLFIKKESDYPFQRIAFRIRNFYNNTGETIHPGNGPTTFLYRFAAIIKFNAYIVFGQDNFLKNAFEELGIVPQFLHYSSRGPQRVNPLPTAERSANGEPGDDTPVIYNISGDYNNPQSLITDYESYYKFLFAILGDDNFFPEIVKTRISNAQVFLFLGFDLKRWYVPLIVNRFYSIGNVSLRAMFASSMNDTDVTNNEEYVSWLGRYPLHLQPIGDTASFLESVAVTPNGEQKGLLRSRKKNGERPGTPCYQHPAFLEKREGWFMALGETTPGTLMLLMDELIVFFNEHGFKQCVGTILLVKASLYTARDDLAGSCITQEVFETKVAMVRRWLLEYLSQE